MNRIDDIREHHRRRSAMRCVGQGFTDDDIGALLDEIERVKNEHEAERVRWTLLEPVAEHKGYARCQADVVAWLRSDDRTEAIQVLGARAITRFVRDIENGAAVGAATRNVGG